jgi:hypothetical protein
MAEVGRFMIVDANVGLIEFGVSATPAKAIR